MLNYRDICQVLNRMSGEDLLFVFFALASVVFAGSFLTAIFLQWMGV